MKIFSNKRSVVFFSIAMCSLFTAAGAEETCSPVVGRLVSMEGQVEVQHADSSTWMQAALEMVLCQGDTIRANQNSRVALALINEAVLRVDQNTAVRLTDIVQEENDTSLLGLLRGALQSFSRSPRQLEVDSPYLNGLIEGTEFVVRVEQNQTSLTVLEGTVRAFNQQGSVAATPGTSVVAQAGQAPQSSVLVKPRDAAQWALYYPPVLTVQDAPAGSVLQEAIRLAEQADVTAALAALEKIPGADRDARFFLYRSAVLLSVGRIDAARSDLERVLAAEPQNGLAYALRAVIGIAQNDKTGALADANQAVTLSSQDAAPKIALSYALQANFLISEAHEVMLEAVQAQADNPLAWARLSELWLMQGDRRQAVKAAQRATELAPEQARAQSTLGFAALAEFRTAQARAAFERAAELSPADPLPRLGLGLARIGAGELAEGRQELEIAVGLDANNALLRSYLGKAYFEERRAPLDNQQFDIAKELDPFDPTPYLYAGIAKQTENRPVEALRNLEASIERNDNRATYRSKLLLDQDRAARGTSLARVYSDLGFSQLGIDEAAKSLAIDPANASAHRFLSDTYRDVRRREISRVSELLQAQLMQDININPVQPSLSETNLNVITLGGPATPGFNEFTPLFQRNTTQLDVAGFAGNNDTIGGEAVVSGLYDRFSLSAGVYSYDTDGFRVNNDLKHSIFNFFAQAAVTPELNVQAELRRRESESGDLALNFDPASFFPDLRREFDEDSARFGLRWSPNPSSAALLSLIYSDRTEDGRVTQDLLFPDGSTAQLLTETHTQEDARQAEGQYLYRHEQFNLLAGAAYANVDQDVTLKQSLVDITDLPGFSAKETVKDSRAYIYSTINLPSDFTWTMGLSFQKYKQEDALDFDRINPKLGLQWQVNNSLRLRAAYFKVVKPALASNRTIEPTQIAGFNQFFDDANATKSTLFGAGIDWRPSKSLFLGAEAIKRTLEWPILSFSPGEEAQFEDRDEWLHRAYAYWTPTDRWSLSLEAVYDKYTNDNTMNPDLPLEVRTVSVPFQAQYFHPTGLFAGARLSYVDQKVRRSEFSLLSDGDSDFVVVDLAAGYRFPSNNGIISLAVQNLFDEDFDYQDDSFRTFQDEPSTGPYIPERTIMARFTLNF